MSILPESDSRAQFISYSINYEDIVLRRVFPDRTDGFFVDVGAEHPCLGNDFYGLYTLGWTGINIEPNESYFRLLKDQRPRDRNLQLALSDVSGKDLVFFEVEDTGLSTCDEQQAEAYAARGYTVKRHNVRTSTLKDVLDDARPPHIDILKVDVEGFEERVLLGNDWGTYRPSIIMVEATYPLSPVRRPTNIRRNLDAVGYRHFHFDSLNDFYAEDSFTVPSEGTLPPNVFDNFVRYDTLCLRDENASLKASFASAENYAHTLEAERASLEATISGLRTLTEDRERDLASLRQQNHQLLDAAQRSNDAMHQATAVAHGVRQLAIASMSGRTDQVQRMLTAEIVPTNPEPPKRQQPVLEQSKELTTVSGHNVLDENEPRSPVKLLPTDVTLELLVARLQTLVSENDRLANDLKDLRHENRRLLASTSQMHGENLSLRRALGPAYAVNDELALIRRRLDESLAPQHSEAAKLLNAVHMSTSWRLTKPLRAVGRLLKSRSR